MKIIKKEIWLISETEKMARDNGYVFFKYMKEKHPDIECYYAIDYKSPDYEKVNRLGNVIKWSSLKHYYLYMISTWNISSHKEGNPNHPLFSFLHLKLNLYNNRVFLQHGITKDNIKMFYYKNTKFKYFICGSKIEEKFIKEKFGYPESSVVCTGFARFDNLHDINVNKEIILFVPTWRRWIKSETELKCSNYLKKINEFLESKRLKKILEENNKLILFYPHVNMQTYKDKFCYDNKNIILVDLETEDIQDLLKKSSMLITDYSSISFDFAYMKKNVLYYQFDEEEYRLKHMPEGYFDYKRDGFGYVEKSLNNVLKRINESIKSDFIVQEKHNKNIEKFFTIIDENNCERIFNLLKGV